MKDPQHPVEPPAPTANRRGHDNLIPDAANRVSTRGGPNTLTYTHMRFVIWAMQHHIDDVTVRRVKDAMRVSTTTAQNFREGWRHLTSTRFYRDSVPDIVNVLTRIHNLPQKAANDD